jgi:hypothetical protein
VVFTPGKTSLAISDVQDRSFLVTLTNDIEEVRTVGHFVATAHNAISALVMAINVASLGHFTWASKSTLYSPYVLTDPTASDSTARVSIRAVQSASKVAIRKITEEEVRRTALLFIALAKERDDNVRAEYIKGIIHLGLDVYGMSFYKDAFANFYRSLEFLVTERILKVKNLANEQRDIQNALDSLGFSRDIVDEFGSLYRLRCGQVMHAQKKQTEIQVDDAHKMKVILDAVLFKLYRPVWEKTLRKTRQR